MPIIPEMPIMPIIPGMPEMPIIPGMLIMPVINFAKVCVTKSDTSELSEENEKVRKRGGRIFDEKRV